jgi:phenylacetate-CoA ligase
VALECFPRIKSLAQRILAAVPLSMRLGKEFWEWYAFYQESETWPLQRLHEYQFEKLRRLLIKLKQDSRYYRERLKHIDCHRIDSFSDLRLIPPLTRQEFKDNYGAILSESYQELRLIKSNTSGTTGLAIQFYHDAGDEAREWAAINYQWKRVGYDPGRSRRAEFRGLTGPGKVTEIFPHLNMLRCSILMLRKPYVLTMANEIRKNKIDFYHGYPSALYLLASEILNESIKFPQPKAILLASEMVYDWQTTRIQEAFPKAKLYAHYGCAERTVLAGWCEHRMEYHVLPQYALVETDPSTSEVIGTNLHNAVNGFIRYRMTDRVLQSSQEICPDCGRPYIPRWIQLGGRAEDYLYSPENGWISPAIVTYPLKHLRAIRELQFRQKEPNQIVVRYTVGDSNKMLLKKELIQIESGLRRLTGAGIHLDFVRVETFPRGTTGKFKWIICDLDTQAGQRSH